MPRAQAARRQTPVPEPPPDAAAPGGLAEYAARRDFARTPEPAGAEPERAADEGLLFAIQKHSATRLHYDLRLELDGVLKSWAVPNGPSLNPADRRLAVMTEDHPMQYTQFEGVIPKGNYGAGEMIVWDQGTYGPESDAPLSREEAEARLRRQLADGKLTVVLNGRKLRGAWTLVRTAKSPRDWLLIKRNDAAADPGRDILAEDGSVLTGLTIDDLKVGRRAPRATPDGPAPAAESTAEATPGARPAPFPGAIAPMMPSSATLPFTHPDWSFEPKLDGYRVIAAIRDGRVTLYSRRGLDCTKEYPTIVAELASQPTRDVVFDGEVVVLDERGRPSFGLLQERLELERRRKAGEAVNPIVYYVFDLLYRDGIDLRGAALERRRPLLEQTLKPSVSVRLVEQIPGQGEVFHRAAREHGLEGLVAKHRQSAYESGRRSTSWLKIKETRTDEFVVGGYTRGKGGRQSTLGALVLGQYDDDGRLQFVGCAGSGFDDRTATETRRRLDALRIEESPFAGSVEAMQPVTWVRPEMVVEVKFAEWTRDRRLRAPVFLRARPDKTAGEVVHTDVVAAPAAPAEPPAASADDEVASVLAQLESDQNAFTLAIGPYRLPITNLDKHLWPDFDKRDLLRYLAVVSPYLRAHMRDRPITLIRFPDGVDGNRFYQRHWQPRPEFVETVAVYSDHKDRDGQLVLCQNLATLLAFGQYAAIEMHASYARIAVDAECPGHTNFAGTLENVLGSALNYPDFVVFDLDPVRPPGVETPGFDTSRFKAVCRVAHWLRELLDRLQMSSFVKTSGRSGLHVYVPIVRRLDYDATRSVSVTLARFLKQAHPQEIALEWVVSKRAGEVFVDTNQNVRIKTLASIYSPRATKEGTVSVPLRWDEVGKADPREFTLATVPERLRQVGDLWGDVLDARNDLQARLGL